MVAQRRASTRPTPRPAAETTLAARQRAVELLRTEIDFVPNPEFRSDTPSRSALVDATLQLPESSARARLSCRPISAACAPRSC